MRNNESDATIIRVEENQRYARESQLISVAHETTDVRYFIVIDKSLSSDQLYKLPM